MTVMLLAVGAGAYCLCALLAGCADETRLFFAKDPLPCACDAALCFDPPLITQGNAPIDRICWTYKDSPNHGLCNADECAMCAAPSAGKEAQ